MTDPRKGRAGLSLVFRDMTVQDLDHILPIEKASFSHPWTKRQFQEELGRRPFSMCLVAVAEKGAREEAGGGLAAYVTAWLVADELHITNLAVDPRFRGQGVARRLMGEIMSRARAGGARWCGLEVRVSNLPAIALYRGMGFAVSGMRKRYYSNREDALVMERQLPDGRV